MSTTDPSKTPTSAVAGIPLNRIIAFGGPYIAIASGAVANWLFVHVHLFATFHVTPPGIAKVLAQVFVFGLTSLLVWLGQHKWLDGWQKWENSIVPEVEKVLNEVGPVAAGSKATTIDSTTGGGLVTGAPKAAAPPRPRRMP